MTVAIDLKGRRGLVTGAAGGLGAAVAHALAHAGADVAVSDLDGDGLGRVAEDVAGLGVRAPSLPADLTDFGQAGDLVDSVTSSLGGLDLLVNCAGIMQTRPLLDLTAEQWRRMVDVNLTGAFAVTQAAGRVMVDGGGGSIVTLASVAARSGRPLAAHYAASKAALLSLTKSAAAAFAPTVRVNAVCPGVFLTPMWDEIMADRARLHGASAGAEFLERVTSAAPLGRDGDPRELANAVLFLSSDLASYVTGQALNVDGGLEMD